MADAGLLILNHEKQRVVPVTPFNAAERSGCMRMKVTHCLNCNSERIPCPAKVGLQG